MHFASDNWAGAHPKITEALARHADGYAAAYGASALDRQVEERFGALFERPVAVFFVGTGTAANALALSAAARPGGVAFAHREAHAIEDEGGAPEFFSGGGRLRAVDGDDGKIDPVALEAAIARFPPGFVHGGQPTALTLTQASEIGTVYTLGQIDRLAESAARHGLMLHMDGARFANALVHLDVSPADMTWRRGIDMVSFGGTKNGCWCAEALVVLDPDKAAGLTADMAFLRKRAAQLFSKSRFIAAQFDAYLEGGLWLDLARHANAMAGRLRAGIEASARTRLAWPSQTNEVFAVMTRDDAERWRAKGAAFHDWGPPRAMAAPPGPDETLVRLVTSFATTEEDVDAFCAMIAAP